MTKEETTPLSAEEVLGKYTDLWWLKHLALKDEIILAMTAYAASQPSPQVEDRIVYVPIKVEDELPEEESYSAKYSKNVIAIDNAGIKHEAFVEFENKKWWLDHDQDMEFEDVTHWLKPVNLSTLTSIK